MTKQDAQALVSEYLAKMQARYLREFAILERLTREEDFGWIFFYNSKRFVETGDLQWALAGNAPLIVDRRTGTLHVTGTAHSIEHYIDEYRRSHPQL